jgi:hypothetical protein
MLPEFFAALSHKPFMKMVNQQLLQFDRTVWATMHLKQSAAILLPANTVVTTSYQ